MSAEQTLQILAFMEKEAQRRCIAVNVSIRGPIPAFQSERGNLQQIFLNLVNNAFAAMDDGGHLDIAVRRKGANHILVAVSDTGHGIPEADRFHYGAGLALPGFRRSYRWRSVPLSGITLNFYQRIPEEDPQP